MKATYFCPVCGYDALADPPADYSICTCCGTEFGYHDLTRSWEALRDRWIASGARWFSDYTPPPPDWDVLRQLSRLAAQNVSADKTIEAAGVNRPGPPPTVLEAPVREAASNDLRPKIPA